MRAERRWPALLAATALGALHAASFSPPIGGWWLQSLCLAALVGLACRHGEPGRAWLLAMGFGVGSFGAGLAWLYTSMHVYGGMPSPLAILAVLLFALYLSIFHATAIALACRLSLTPDERSRSGLTPVVGPALAIGGAWGLAEMLRGWALTGFPWLAIGYAHLDGPLTGFAPWIGVYGIGTLAATIAALAGISGRMLAQRTGTSARLLVPLSLCAGTLAIGAVLARLPMTEPVGEPVTVRLIQGNVPQQLKFDRTRALRAMDDYARLVESSSAALVVLPETAWTVPWAYTPPDIAGRIRRHAEASGAAIAIGMPLTESLGSGNGITRYTNSVALIAGGGGGGGGGTLMASPARYDKQHLVPFGEFVPLGFRWFVDLMRIPLGDFARGRADQVPFAVGGQRFAFNVCYEDLFGEELLAPIRDPRAATVLVNVSNIAWFGNSHALPQHLAIARMRTLETGRPMLRATNTGVTASIDHRGRVLAELPPYTQAALDVEVRGTGGLTPYVRFGNAIAAVIAASMLAGAGLIGRRRKLRKR